MHSNALSIIRHAFYFIYTFIPQTIMHKMQKCIFLRKETPKTLTTKLTRSHGAVAAVALLPADAAQTQCRASHVAGQASCSTTKVCSRLLCNRLAVLKQRERAQVAAETMFGHELIVAPEVVEDLT